MQGTCSISCFPFSPLSLPLFLLNYLIENTKAKIKNSKDTKSIDDSEDAKLLADVKAQCADSGAEYVERMKARQKETETFIAQLPQRTSTERTRRLK